MRLRGLLEQAVALGASDIHILNGSKATIRIDGELTALDSEVLEPKIIDSLCHEALDIDKHEAFKPSGE